MKYYVGTRKEQVRTEMQSPSMSALHRKYSPKNLLVKFRRAGVEEGSEHVRVCSKQDLIFFLNLKVSLRTRNEVKVKNRTFTTDGHALASLFKVSINSRLSSRVSTEDGVRVQCAKRIAQDFRKSYLCHQHQSLQVSPTFAPRRL